MKAVFSEDTRHHDPKFYLLRGKVRQAAEQPERATRLLAGLAATAEERARGGLVVAAP